MELRFTKYAFTNALWSLIPVFPIFTIFPCVLLAMGIENIIHNCEKSYTIVLWLSIVTILLISIFYILRLDKALLQDEKLVKNSFRLINFILYILFNTVVFIIMVGVDLACNGDGQTALVAIISGPISSLLLIVFGFLIDLK